MIDDIWVFRDGFVLELAQAFIRIGWKGEYRKNEDYWSFLWKLQDAEVSTSFSKLHIEQPTIKPVASLSVGLSKHELNVISEQIFPKRPGYEQLPTIVAGCLVKREIPGCAKDHSGFFKKISDEIVQWAKEQNIESCIRSFATPWETEKQLTHLAALAYVGDFNTLMDYQQMFKQGNRANFYPMIKSDMIDRAVDIAVERS